jgi:U3 small nucleolar RNA-associated protein 23
MVICEYLENLTPSESSSNFSQKHYVVATQDRALRGALSGLPGVPLVYLNKVILVLEPMSETSRRYGSKVGCYEIFFIFFNRY